MGVNVYLVLVDGDEVANIDWWDSDRMAGDSALYHDDSLEWVYPSVPVDAIGIVQRPKNWIAFIGWVQANVPVEDQQRWARAIAAMALDKRLFFQFVG